VNGNLGGIGDFLEAAVLLLASPQKAFAELRRIDVREGAAGLLGS